MAKTKTTPKLLNILVIEVPSLKNSALYTAFMLMSQALESANCWWLDEGWIEQTSPLKFRFTEQLLVFYRSRKRADILLNHLLPQSSGIIVNLGGRALDINYLAGNDESGIFHPAHLKMLVQSVYEMKRPVVFAVEDLRDSFERNVSS